jgi:hypothetical protein
MELLDAYVAALHAFHMARNSFSSNLSADHAAASAGCDTKEEAFNALARKRDLYCKHVQMHNSRSPVA